MHNRRKLAVGGLVTAVSYLSLRGRFRRYEIVERSMRPTLDPGDFIIAARVHRLCRGLVVIFNHPEVPELELVKRVVGLPGEKVTIDNGQVAINGAVLAERWADGPTLPAGEWQLEGNDVFVLGDNRVVSSGDSRSLGSISCDAIGWRVAVRYWPPGSVGRITPQA
jgi:signal peptidase I